MLLNLNIGRTVKCAFLALATSVLFAGSFSVVAAVDIQDEVLTSDKWQVDCESAKNIPGLSCIAAQQVKTTPSNKTVLGIMLAKSASDKSPHLILRFSANAIVEKGVAIKVDQHSFFRAPINGCDDQVCEVKTLVTNELVLQMIQGQNMYVAFFVEGAQVTYPASLKGFDESIKQVVASI